MLNEPFNTGLILKKCYNECQFSGGSTMSMKHQEKNMLTILSNTNMSYIRWDKHNNWGFRQVYSLHLNIMDRDLAANCPVIHTILREQRVLKLQSNMLGVASLLQCFPGTVTI